MLAWQAQAHPFIVKPQSGQPHNYGAVQCLCGWQVRAAAEKVAAGTGLKQTELSLKAGLAKDLV
jgi:hypothetical protein